MFYDMINPSMLARIRAQAGAPVIAGAENAQDALPVQAGLSPELVQSGCDQLLAQIEAAGYTVSGSSSAGPEGQSWSYEITWIVPSPDGEDVTVLASVGQTEFGWSANLDISQANDPTESLTLEAVALDDSTFLRWMSVWLDAGLSRHAFLATQPVPDDLQHAGQDTSGQLSNSDAAGGPGAAGVAISPVAALAADAGEGHGQVDVAHASGSPGDTTDNSHFVKVASEGFYD